MNMHTCTDCVTSIKHGGGDCPNHHVATNTHVVSSKAFRQRTEAFDANPYNRAEAHSLMAYVKRNPLVVCLATNFDIIALSRASELVGE